MEVGAQPRDAIELGIVGKRDSGIGRKRPEPCKRLARTLAERAGHVLGEAKDPAFGDARTETEAVRHRRGNEERSRCFKVDRLCFARHLPAAASDQQDRNRLR